MRQYLRKMAKYSNSSTFMIQEDLFNDFLYNDKGEYSLKVRENHHDSLNGEEVAEAIESLEEQPHTPMPNWWVFAYKPRLGSSPKIVAYTAKYNENDPEKGGIELLGDNITYEGVEDDAEVEKHTGTDVEIEGTSSRSWEELVSDLEDAQVTEQ